MTPDEIKRLIAEATPGRWRIGPDEEGEPAQCLSAGGFEIATLWGGYLAADANARLIAAAPDLAAQVVRLTEALTLIERLYYLEDKDAEWRAARMNGVAREAQNGGDLTAYHRIFPRASLEALI